MQANYKNHSGPGMAQTLSIGICTNLNLSSNGGLLQFYLERAGVDANRRTLPPEEVPVRSNLSPSHSARQVWMVHTIGC